MISQKKGVDIENEDGAKKLEDVEEVNRKPDNDASLGKIADDVMLAMANLIDLGIITVRRTDLWLEIEIKNSILFRSGSASLKQETLPVLVELARILYMFPNAVRIEGHTDNVAISTKQYPSNWELSAARASSIARLFEISRIIPERLSVVGYGSTRSVADNSTVEGRDSNRRVVIVVVANNDVARTIKRAKRKDDIPFPDEGEIKASGLVDSEAVFENPVDSSVTPESSLGAGAAGTEDELVHSDTLLYRDSVSGFIPSSRLDLGEDNIISPVISSPIRLFSPINLPRPINLQAPLSRSKE
jgi:outer membrane protein OmpA-like peptidoglycan-associated protein